MLFSKDIGPGVYEAIWKLILAIVFYMLMLVITFGIKVPCGLFVPRYKYNKILLNIIGILKTF